MKISINDSYVEWEFNFEDKLGSYSINSLMDEITEQVGQTPVSSRIRKSIISQWKWGNWIPVLSRIPTVSSDYIVLLRDYTVALTHIEVYGVGTDNHYMESDVDSPIVAWQTLPPSGPVAGILKDFNEAVEKYNDDDKD